jgi:hypothetical protein
MQTALHAPLNFSNRNPKDSFLETFGNWVKQIISYLLF